MCTRSPLAREKYAHINAYICILIRPKLVGYILYNINKTSEKLRRHRGKTTHFLFDVWGISSLFGVCRTGLLPFEESVDNTIWFVVKHDDSFNKVCRRHPLVFSIR